MSLTETVFSCVEGLYLDTELFIMTVKACGLGEGQSYYVGQMRTSLVSRWAMWTQLREARKMHESAKGKQGDSTQHLWAVT